MIASIASHSKLFIPIPKMASGILFLALLALTSSLAIASDPSPLQDFCVADNTSPGNLTCFLILLYLLQDDFPLLVSQPAT